MEELLKYLATKKNQLYMFFRNTPGALTYDQCLFRIHKQIEYETILEVIAMLPPHEGVELGKIERDLFPDAPYIHG